MGSSGGSGEFLADKSEEDRFAPRERQLSRLFDQLRIHCASLFGWLGAQEHDEIVLDALGFRLLGWIFG
jgi:hypothetical protein